MVGVKYTLDDFVQEMDDLLATQPDNEKIFDRGSDYLSRLIANPDAIPERFRLPVGTGSRSNHGSWLLHHSPDSGLLVTAVVWGPGDHADPHDHRTWGMIGVMDNALTETRFRRVDNRQRDDWAQLERDRSGVAKPGEITLLIPEVDEIHQMDNFTDRPTVEIHVYGNDLRGLERVRYDLETCAVKPMMTHKFDNC